MMPSMIPIARASYADTLRNKTSTLTPGTKLPASVKAKAVSGVIAVDAFPEPIAPSKMGQSDPNKASVGMIKPITRKASYASVLRGDTARGQKLPSRVAVSSTTPIEVNQDEEKPQEMGSFIVVARKPVPATKLPKKKNVIHRAFDFIATSVLPAKAQKIDAFKPINQSEAKKSSKNVPIPELGELQNNSSRENKFFKTEATSTIRNTSDVIGVVAPKNILKAPIKNKLIQKGKPVPLKNLSTIPLPLAENAVREGGAHKKQYMIPAPVHVSESSRVPNEKNSEKKIQIDHTNTTTPTSENLEVREVEKPKPKPEFNERVKIVAAELRRRAVVVSSALSQPYGEDDISWIPAPATPKASPKSLENQGSIYPIFAAISHIMPTPLAHKDKGSKNLYTLLDIPLEDSLDDPLDLPTFDDCFDKRSDISVKSFRRSISTPRFRDHSPVPDRLSLIRKAKAPLNPIPMKVDGSTHHTSIPTPLDTSDVTTRLSKPMAATKNLASQNSDRTSTAVVDVKGTVLPEVKCHISSNRLFLKKEKGHILEEVGADSLPRTPTRPRLAGDREKSPERMVEIIPTLLDHSKQLEEDLDRILESFRPPSPEPWDFMEELRKSGSAKKVTPTKTTKDPYELAAELLAAEKKAVSSVKPKVGSETINVGGPENKNQGEPGNKILRYDSPPGIAHSKTPATPITAIRISTKPFLPSSNIPPPSTPTFFPTPTPVTTTDLRNTGNTFIGCETPTSTTHLQHERREQRLLKTIPRHKIILQRPPVTPRKHLPKSRLPLKQFRPHEQNKGVNNKLTTNNTANKQIFKKDNARELPLTKNHSTPIYPVASESERNRRTYHPRVSKEENLNRKQHEALEDGDYNEQVASIKTWTGIVARETREAACLNGLSPVRKTLDEWNFMDRLFESKIAEIPRKRLDFNPKCHLLPPSSPNTPIKGQDREKLEGKEGGNCDGDNLTICSADSLALTETGFYLDRCVGKKDEYLDIDIAYSDMSLDHNTFRQTLELQLLFEMIIERSGYDDFECLLWEFGDSNLLPLV
ncbi:uncharacterized protein LAJ45_00980 [Morchella importuna]|uniref:uncharacterized protein n=1 Tax=Morchella importuna TaxID=1174673 RepID=UPI001E8D2718|nr:uncharacterized protein LAJ45_00980 [Morchella importuna]KAH8154453.1 hypothetical protein LAJ45_00980 [Morchella importuna]